VTTVRVARAEPRPGWQPDGSFMIGRYLVALADDETGRVLALWLQSPEGYSLWRLVDRPDAEAVTAAVLEETAARLLDVAGVTVTAVDLEVTAEDAAELDSDTVAARIGLALAGGTRQVTVSAGYGLAMALASGALIRVPDAVMDQRAVPVHGDDPLAPFLPPGDRALARQPDRWWRFEPRNLAFTDGLDRWDLAGSFLAGHPDRQDYCATAEGRCAALASAVPEPHGFAVLVQTIFADDYRGRTVTFRGELRTRDAASHAGLHLAAGHQLEPPGSHLRDRGATSLASPGSDWMPHEATLRVRGDAAVVRFGISLTGPGRVELRNAELTAGS
jgi:hypothetical protein